MTTMSHPIAGVRNNLCVCHESNFLWNHVAKQTVEWCWKAVSSLLMKSWTGSRVVGPSNRHVQHPRPPFKSGKPAGAVPPPRESPRAVETAILPAMSTGRKQNPEDCHTLGWIMKILMIWDVFLLHSDHLPQQHILMHCASVTLSDNNCGNDEGAKCRWTMLNPSTSQRNFWLLGKTLFKHCTCLGNFRQRRGFKFYHLQKAKLRGFKGIACRISMFQYMFHLHRVACEGFGFLYVQLELLVDDGHELWAKYHGERSKLESLRVGKQKAKKKDVGAEKA